MHRLLAEIIDHYALYTLHRDRSKQPHFKNSESVPPMDLNHFYFNPQIPKVSFRNVKEVGQYRSGEFYYNSEVENEACNEYATGTFYEFNAAQLDVILVHGWRQDNERIKAIYLEPFIKNNYNMYFYTLPHHTERQDRTSLYNGEFMISANIEKTLSSVKQAVVDLRALIQWLKINRTGTVLLIGISLGGLLVNLTATVEKNIDGIISVFAPNDLSEITWNTITGKFIKKDFVNHSFSHNQLQKCWAITKTSNFDTLIQKEKILFFSALYDKYISSKDSEMLWEKWGKPKRKIYQCGHAGIALCKERIATDSLEFIKENILGNGGQIM